MTDAKRLIAVAEVINDVCATYFVPMSANSRSALAKAIAAVPAPDTTVEWRDYAGKLREEVEFLEQHIGDLAHFLQVITPNEEALAEAYHKARYGKERAQKALALEEPT